MKHMLRPEWEAEGRRLFGDDQMQWRFVCPACGHVASVKDWQDAGAEEDEVAFSCVGRHSEKPRGAFVSKFTTKKNREGPCNYAGGGLFKLNPVEVDGHNVFDFAEPLDV